MGRVSGLLAVAPSSTPPTPTHTPQPAHKATQGGGRVPGVRRSTGHARKSQPSPRLTQYIQVCVTLRHPLDLFGPHCPHLSLPTWEDCPWVSRPSTQSPWHRAGTQKSCCSTDLRCHHITHCKATANQEREHWAEWALLLAQCRLFRAVVQAVGTCPEGLGHIWALTLAITSLLWCETRVTVRGVRPGLLWNVGHGRKPGDSLTSECQQG